MLGLFGLLGVCDSIESSIGFSSFALFELYDGIPPESALSGIDASQDGEDKDMYVRVKCNFNPFFDKENRVVTEETMQDANMVVLKDYRVVDLKKHLESVRSARDEKNLLHAEGTPTATPLSRLKSSADGHGETFYFSKHSDPDSSYCNSTVNSPICDFDIPRIDDCLDLITNPCSEDND